MCKKLPEFNSAALIASAIVFVVIVFYKKAIEAQLARKIPFPIPIDLVIVSLSHRLKLTLRTVLVCTLSNSIFRTMCRVVGRLFLLLSRRSLLRRSFQARCR